MASFLRATVLACVVVAAGAADATRVLCSFEDDAEVAHWELKEKSGQPSPEHATHGKRSLKIAGNEYVNTTFYQGIAPGDWSGFDALELDVFVGGSAPVPVTLLVGDQAWQEKPTYWNRHNGGFTLKPGANSVSIPVNGLFRGEAGSRGNDLKTNIDPAHITRIDLGFGAGADTPIWIDHVRLTKEDRPEGILAFDFGPESQTVFPGFTPITWNTVHGGAVKAGLRRALGDANRGRDDTSPTRLYQDWLDFSTIDGDEFLVDLPNGTWHGWLMFSDCGYWGGESAHFRRRAIVVEGKEVEVEDRGDAGPGDALSRFEDVEATPGCDVWKLFYQPLFTAHRFSAQVTDGQLNLSIASETAWSGKVAALILYPDAKKAAAEAWIATIEQRNRDEALSRAVCMDPPARPLDPPKAAQAAGWWLGAPTLGADLRFADAPGAPLKELARTAARGQRVATTFAVRPLKDFADAALAVGELKGPAGSIPAKAVDLRYVHHQLRRGFNGIAYGIGPMDLRPVAGAKLKLAKDLTRQFWVTVAVPADAKPGRYAGELTLTAGALKQAIPLAIDVLDVDLAEVDYPRGMFGMEPTAGRRDRDTELRELMTLFRDHGMTTYSGGPNIAFGGFDAAGSPKLDFAPLDHWFALAKECGFTGEVFRYGSPGWVDGLYDGAHRQAWEASGKAFPDLLKVVWTAVDAHAKQAGWPRINYGMIDEPRVVEGARELRAFLQLHRDAVPFLRIGGFYSVEWGKDDEFDREIQAIFRTVVWNGMNLNAAADLAESRKLGTDLYLYNQGTDRTAYGAYTWSRMNQGAKGMICWHAFAVSGYQYFDLDGREPDFAMYQIGRAGLYPTLPLARSAEGVADLRFAATLQRAARAAGDKPEAKEALAWLDARVADFPPGARDAKPGQDEEALRDGCIARLRKLAGR